jgi:molecular chaperone GrpE (heat shock protein)
MSEIKPPRVNRWPFLLGDVLLLGLAGFIIYGNALPMDFWEAVLCTVTVMAAAWFGVWPFLLEYRAATRLAEYESVGDLTAQAQRFEETARQIHAATGQWQSVQESATRTNAAAKEIADKMSVEAKAFGEFLQKAQEAEIGRLRLEVEKARRGEKEWLQVAVRMLDHIYALYSAAARSNQPELSRQIGNFQFACRDAARRVGLAPFVAEPGERFDPKLHTIPDQENPPAEPMRVLETLGTGYTFQGSVAPARAGADRAFVQ